MTTIKVICFKYRPNKAGECPLRLVVCKDRKRTYHALGISLKPIHWDFEKDQPKKSCPNKEHIQKIIADKIAELQSTVLEFEVENRSYTSSSLIATQHNKVNKSSVEEFFQQTIQEYQDQGQVGNRNIYKRTLNSVLNFTNGRLNIPFCEIDVEWLNRYEKWLRSRKNKETTISILFRTIRSLYNKAIKQHYARKNDYPFDEYKINKFNTKTAKRAITKADIMNIYNAQEQSPYPSPYFELSKDIFMFSYLCGGINFIDICNLKEENIADGRLSYVRQKTGRSIRLGIPRPALEIISKYKAERKGYLFPIFDESLHITPVQKQDRKHKVLAYINKHLNEIGINLGLSIRLTTYVARHSFATILKKSGVEIALISEMLGHAELTTTQIYLDSFDDEQVDNAMMNLL